MRTVEQIKRDIRRAEGEILLARQRLERFRNELEELVKELMK